MDLIEACTRIPLDSLLLPTTPELRQEVDGASAARRGFREGFRRGVLEGVPRTEFGTDLGTDLGTDFEPIWEPISNRFRTPNRFRTDFRTDFEPISNRFRTDFGTDFGTDFSHTGRCVGTGGSGRGFRSQRATCLTGNRAMGVESGFKIRVSQVWGSHLKEVELGKPPLPQSKHAACLQRKG